MSNRSAPSSSQSPVLQSTLNLLLRFERFAADVAGLLVLTLGGLTILAQINLSEGGLLNPWRDLLRVWFGWGSLLIGVMLAGGGVWLLMERTPGRRPDWGRVITLEAAAFCALGLLAFMGGADLARADAGLDGGRIGWGLLELLTIIMPAGLGGLVLFLGMLGFGISAFGWTAHIGGWLRQSLEHSATSTPPVSPLPSAMPDNPILSSAQDKRPARKVNGKPLPAEFRKNFHLEPKDEKPANLPPRHQHLPPLEILSDERLHRPDERTINMTAGLIEKTLADFGIQARVIGFQVGPTITQYAVEPGFLNKLANNEEEAIRQKVRVAQIANLNRDLTLALSAERLRIEAPVPGRPYIGIEVPNAKASIVRLRPLLETEQFHKLDSPLALALGRDVSGRPVVADLARMPHLLIAGTTGSGKSVCIAALAACLAFNNTPEDLRLVMIDPKMVELVRFNGLPHLLGKVETDVERILGVLRWAVTEMDRRYKVLEQSRARNIETHNRKMHQRRGETLPRIVLFIDELADLMLSAPEQTEPSLVRLAQLARAVGIHLVVATQRPSTDVVTGLIKANFPARIAFAVASSIDSRVILDTVGAESLLGRGDMLFQPPDAPAPMRAQGVWITENELDKLMNFWKSQQSGPDGQSAADAGQPETPPWEDMLQADDLGNDTDGLIEQAIEIVRTTQRASASLLQRRLRVGYPRAARLMDELEDMGVVGPATGGRERDVLIGPPDGAED